MLAVDAAAAIASAADKPDSVLAEPVPFADGDGDEEFSLNVLAMAA